MPAGRPTKYTKPRIDAILNVLKMGATRLAAAEGNGIDYDTFRRWLTNYTDFYAAVTQAESQAELLFTSVLYKAGKGTAEIPGDWRAAESWLKRRRRHEWSDNLTVRNDSEAARLLAELFAENAGDGLGAASIGIES